MYTLFVHNTQVWCILLYMNGHMPLVRSSYTSC